MPSSEFVEARLWDCNISGHHEPPETSHASEFVEARLWDCNPQILEWLLHIGRRRNLWKPDFGIATYEGLYMWHVTMVSECVEARLWDCNALYLLSVTALSIVGICGSPILGLQRYRNGQHRRWRTVGMCGSPIVGLQLNIIIKHRTVMAVSECVEARLWDCNVRYRLLCEPV